MAAGATRPARTFAAALGRACPEMPGPASKALVGSQGWEITKKISHEEPGSDFVVPQAALSAAFFFGDARQRLEIRVTISVLQCKSQV